VKASSPGAKRERKVKQAENRNGGGGGDDGEDDDAHKNYECRRPY